MNPAAVAWGAGMIGFVLSAAIYGITIAQTIFYWLTFPEDHKLLKALVTLLLVLDTVHIIWMTQSFWVLLIAGRNNVEKVTYMPWELPAGSLYTSIVTFIVQSFFTVRVWRLSEGNKILTGTIVTFTLAQILAGMIFGSRGVVSHAEFNEYTNGTPITVELSASVVSDVLITSSLVYYIHAKRTGVPRSEGLIRWLIFYTVNIGLIPCLIAFTGLVLLRTEGNRYWSITLFFILSKCYVNSLLATLNARKPLREMFDYGPGSFTLPSLSKMGMPRLPTFAHSGA